MAQDMFLKIGKIIGESTDSTLKGADGWMQILSWSWGVSNQSSVTTGQGLGAGKGNISDIMFNKYVDKATPDIFKHCILGTHHDDATLVVRKAGGDTPVEYLRFEFKKVLISSSQLSGSEGGGMEIESGGLVFAKVKMTYVVQTEKGAADASPNFTYDLQTKEMA